MKDAQATLQKTITWTKKFGEGKQEWKKACIKCGLPFQKFKTLIKTKFASKVIMFDKTLEFKQIIITYYERKNIVVLQQKVPKAQVWAIAKVVTLTLNLMVIVCVMNQSHNHWLLSNVLITTITRIVKL